MQTLTPRQESILTFIKEHIASHGYPPTLREIGARFGIRSTNAINDHLRAMERKGHLRRDATKSRGIILAEFDGRKSSPPGLELRLRVALSKYTILAVQGGRVIEDLAARLAADVQLLEDLERACPPLD